MVTFHNPALYEEPRYEPARIIPLKESEPLLNWLKRTERLFKSHNPARAYDPSFMTMGQNYRISRQQRSNSVGNNFEEKENHESDS